MPARNAFLIALAPLVALALAQPAYAKYTEVWSSGEDIAQAQAASHERAKLTVVNNASAAQSSAQVNRAKLRFGSSMFASDPIAAFADDPIAVLARNQSKTERP